jgi:hypothetical protein
MPLQSLTLDAVQRGERFSFLVGTIGLGCFYRGLGMELSQNIESRTRNT